jgi:hypothetical protein
VPLPPRPDLLSRASRVQSISAIKARRELKNEIQQQKTTRRPGAHNRYAHHSHGDGVFLWQARRTKRVPLAGAGGVRQGASADENS